MTVLKPIRFAPVVSRFFFGALFVPALLLMLVAPPAHAYLDPSVGGLLLQLLLGGVAGAVLVLKLYWKRITSLFRGKKSGEPKQP